MRVRRSRGRFWRILLVLAAVAVLGSLNLVPPRSGVEERPRPGASPAGAEGSPTELPVAAGKVVRVRDGDSIDLAGGEQVRYVGIDAPEVDEPFAEEARRANEGLVLGRDVELRAGGPEPRDRYGRVLAAVSIRAADGASVVRVNEELVERGLASVVQYGPEGLTPELLGALLAAQGQALAARRGFWKVRLETALAIQGSLVATRFRIHRRGCEQLATASPRKVRSVEDELRQGKSFCRTCRPLGADR